MENSEARGWGGGGTADCVFWWEEESENRDHVFISEAGERGSACLEMSQYC